MKPSVFWGQQIETDSLFSGGDFENQTNLSKSKIGIWRKKGLEVKTAITERIRSQETMERQGISMYEMYGVNPDYRKLYVAHNYVFYLIEEQTIRIVNVYHEKADFMWKLFGIRDASEDNYEERKG